MPITPKTGSLFHAETHRIRESDAELIGQWRWMPPSRGMRTASLGQSRRLLRLARATVHTTFFLL